MDIIEFLGARLDEDETQYGGRNGSGRLRLEVQAKRELLAVLEQARQYYNRHPMVDAGEVSGLYTAVKLAASVYADHPDYPGLPWTASE